MPYLQLMTSLLGLGYGDDAVGFPVEFQGIDRSGPAPLRNHNGAQTVFAARGQRLKRSFQWS
jgi:hypothetical protein